MVDLPPIWRPGGCGVAKHPGDFGAAFLGNGFDPRSADPSGQRETISELILGTGYVSDYSTSIQDQHNVIRRSDQRRSRGGVEISE
jgi:hypothetical protein